MSAIIQEFPNLLFVFRNFVSDVNFLGLWEENIEWVTTMRKKTAAEN